MGSVADCFDNALAESVFATLECELFDQQPGGRFTTRREAKLAVFDYLETFSTPAAGTQPSATSHPPTSRPSTPSNTAPSTLSALQPEPQAAATRCPRKRVNSTSSCAVA